MPTQEISSAHLPQRVANHWNLTRIVSVSATPGGLLTCLIHPIGEAIRARRGIVTHIQRVDLVYVKQCQSAAWHMSL